MSSVPPLPSATVHLLLEYIAPPSLLTEPLPPHLLSTPLLQRHRFLALDPAHPADYLAWPHQDSGAVQQALVLLEALPRPLPDDVLRSLQIAYAADPGSIFAHVRITPGGLPGCLPDPAPALRLVFLWDPQDAAWKYHNIALMPFPPNTHPSLDNALHIFHSEDDFLQEQGLTMIPRDAPEDNDVDDVSYWDAYGQGDDDPDAPSSLSASAKHTQGDSEDAYWAQYASVQGSGDSTLPSPLSQKPKLAKADPYHTQDADPTERIIISSRDLRLDIPHTELYNPLQPPSPRNLSRRLAAISARPDSPLLDEEQSSSSTASASGSPTQDPVPTSIVKEVSASPSPEFVVVDAEKYQSEGEEAPVLPHEEDSTRALKDSIRGLYRLWKAGRQRPAASEDDSSAFLDIVRVALVESS